MRDQIEETANQHRNVGLRGHFKLHAGVHAVWLVSILLAIVAWLLIREPNGELIRDYIAFAASLASLLLAVIAIFQGLLSSQSAADTSNILRNSADEIYIAASNISENSKRLNDHSESFLKEISAVSPVVKELTERINERPLTMSSIGEEALTDMFDKLPYGCQVGLYAIALSIVKKKNIEPYRMFGSESIVFGNFVTATLHCFTLMKPYRIQLEYVGDDNSFIFVMRDSGDFPLKMIVERFFEVVDEIENDGTERDEENAINQYFKIKSREELRNIIDHEFAER